mmetsp:Transcript_7195/g.20242  ORF Transcript_7195/g.20242 Transcript_7195/m.20242 type:complete len:105 (-) Transcript_7195:52-366(-)
MLTAAAPWLEGLHGSAIVPQVPLGGEHELRQRSPPRPAGVLGGVKGSCAGATDRGEATEAPRAIITEEAVGTVMRELTGSTYVPSMVSALARPPLWGRDASHEL